ncbi:MAG: hypothetical protein Ct9H300mP18_02270 [Candidatus Neomarinimicrobiota bacterium]|nr:MAG: hypothetical protein Ct9H300mP18_02270 [Candidatus Neomarinimicrobiota bacterium]
MFDELSALPNVHCSMPGGAFYMFPDFSFYLNKKTKNDKILQDTFDLSDYILDTAKVVTVPGDGFGAKGHLRFSFATNNKSNSKGSQCSKRSFREIKMKKDIHSKEYRLVVFEDSSCKYSFLTKSTVKTDKTVKWEDGKEYPLFKIEISDQSHPYYTGQRTLVDTAGRIEKFNRKYGKKTS